MSDIPAHRHSFNARTGDTHVIGKDGKAVNVDQAERIAAAGKKASPKKKAASKKPKRPPAKAAPAPAPTPASGPAE